MKNKPTYNELEQRITELTETLLKTDHTNSHQYTADKEIYQRADYVLQCFETICQAINGAEGIDRTINNLLAAVFDIFQCDRAWLTHPYDKEAYTLKIFAERHKEEHPGAFVLGQEIVIDESAAKTIRTIISSDSPITFGAGSEYKIDKILEPFSVLSQIAMAIHPRSSKPWLLGMHQCSYPRVWTRNEQLLFKEIGFLVVYAINNCILLQDLNESKKRFLDLAERSSDWIWEFDENENFTYSSPSVQRLLGYSPEEIIGKMSAYDLMPPDERKSVREEFEAIKQRKQTFSALINTNLHKSGRKVTIESSGVPITDLNGHFRGYRGIDRDITLRNELENTLKANQRLLEESQHMGKVGGWEFDLDTQNLTWTKETYLIHELDPESDLTIEQAIDFYTPPDSRSTMKQAIKQVIIQGVPFDVELEIITAKGNARYVHAIGKKDSVSRRVYGFFQDITERKQLEVEKEELITDLQSALEEIKTLKGILPICSFCKSIRNDDGYYERIESYMSKHTCVDFSHTICPSCLEIHYPEFALKK